MHPCDNWQAQVHVRTAVQPAMEHTTITITITINRTTEVVESVITILPLMMLSVLHVTILTMQA